MKRFLKWVGIVIASLLVIALLAALLLYAAGTARLNKTYEIAIADIPVPTDSVVVDRGRHLVEAVMLCLACHTETLAGDVLLEAPGIAAVYASNLTSGRGGIGSAYTDTDYVRAIRHGVNRDGRALMIMHSDAYNALSREDLGAIIAYLRSVPPVDNPLPATVTKPLGRIFVALGMFDMEAMPLIPAEMIDHEASFREAYTPDTTAEYGEYLSTIALCGMCHGRDFTGAPPIEEGGVPGPDIAVYGAGRGYSDQEFFATLRTGVTPYGRSLDPESMPWEVYGRMTDDELRAIRKYLGSRPP